ncbi:MAG: hypothetical protein KDC56_10815 [Flavobacteriaceae bacterium]|nr:hypothetical protein [Flavobacteriaceae bacterium]
MKKLLRIVLACSVSLLCFSCYYDTELQQEIPPPPSGVSFANDVLPIFSKCTGCHNGSVASPDLGSANVYNILVPTYVTAGNAENSKLYNRLPGVGHPVDAGFTLTVNEISLIKGWIDQGADNN